MNKASVISILFAALFTATAFPANAQSQTLRNIEDQYNNTFKLALYYSTLKVIGSQIDDSFNDMIRDIEKIRILRFEEDDFTDSFLSDIKESISEEGYEELMTIKSSDAFSAFYVKEKRGNITGYFLILKEGESLNIIDLIGYVPVDKIHELVNKADFESIDKLF